MEEYIRVHFPGIVARLFAIMPTGEAFCMRAGLEAWETDFTGWFEKWKYWGGRQDPTVETNADLIIMPFI